MKCISLIQPWAWLIINCHKDIENRKWNTKFRGRILIQASKGWDQECFEKYADDYPAMPNKDEILRGGIVGMTEIVDVVTSSNSPWFFGPYGFVLKNSTTLPFRKLKGQLSIFNVPLEDNEIIKIAEIDGWKFVCPLGIPDHDYWKNPAGEEVHTWANMRNVIDK
jgi:hypothetical protein